MKNIFLRKNLESENKFVILHYLKKKQKNEK